MQLNQATITLASATTLALAMFMPMTANAAPVEKVVLVHGAFADGAGWRGVYAALTARGYHVQIVQNPLTSVEDGVASTTGLLDEQNGTTILGGHCWGRTVTTEAGKDGHPLRAQDSAFRLESRGSI